MALTDSSADSAAHRAAGSSFYTAMRILPKPQREAMFEIYSFCRRVDDIADSDRPRPERLVALERWRADIEAVYSGRPPPGLHNLRQVVERFRLRQADFLAIIDGMEMDAAADIRAPDWAMLDLYCDRVASAVGRLSVRVFGMDETDGDRLAHHLGRALQLTNILRDLDEDAGVGRLYLPAEALRSAGITGTEPAAVLSHPSLAGACTAVVERARAHFAEADTVMARWPRRIVRAPRIMGEVYRRMLDGMEARGWTPPRARVRIGRARLLWVLLRNAFI